MELSTENEKLIWKMRQFNSKFIELHGYIIYWKSFTILCLLIAANFHTIKSTACYLTAELAFANPMLLHLYWQWMNSLPILLTTEI